MTVNQLIERLRQFDGELKVFINTEMGMKNVTEKMVNNDFLLNWVDRKLVQSDQVIVIYPPINL